MRINTYAKSVPVAFQVSPILGSISIIFGTTIVVRESLWLRIVFAALNTALILVSAEEMLEPNKAKKVSS